MLTDQGHSLHHYTSDVTTSFPVNGKFTEKQAQIYNLVLKASRAVFAKLAPGVDWMEMHKLSERVLLEGLVELGLLTGDAFADAGLFVMDMMNLDQCTIHERCQWWIGWLIGLTYYVLFGCVLCVR